MTANQKVTGRASSMPGGLALGACVNLLITIIGAMFCGWLIGNEKAPEQSIGYCSMFILLAASFLGARTAAAKIKHRILYVSILSGIIYYCSLLAITALFFGGMYQGMGVTALVIMAGCISAALIGQKGERRSRRGKKRMNHR